MPDDTPLSPTGHRSRPHTAGVVVEAWAPSREACIAEAVGGLVEIFVRLSAAAREATTHVFRIPASTDAAALVSVLEEALYVLDMSGQVPISTRINGTEEGVVEGSFTLAAATDYELIGSVPTGISLSGLVFRSDAGRWRCRFTVDVEPIMPAAQ